MGLSFKPKNLEEICIYLSNDVFDFLPHIVGRPSHNIIGVPVICSGHNKLKSVQLELKMQR